MITITFDGIHVASTGAEVPESGVRELGNEVAALTTHDDQVWAYVQTLPGWRAPSEPRTAASRVSDELNR